MIMMNNINNDMNEGEPSRKEEIIISHGYDINEDL